MSLLPLKDMTHWHTILPSYSDQIKPGHLGGMYILFTMAPDLYYFVIDLDILLRRFICTTLEKDENNKKIFLQKCIKSYVCFNQAKLYPI